VPKGPQSHLNELAQAISDGDAVDWAEVESNASPEVRRLLHELRVVAEIASLHRTHDPDELESTIDLPESRVWAHLTLREVIGRGSYGTVYRAWDPQLDREVALKLISETEQRVHAAVVAAEGRLLARVRHRGIVTVYGAARADGFAGLWMELVEGKTLEEILQQQGRFSAREAALIGVDVCEALAAVHSAGLLHRDVKAQNVMRDRSGRILLMDFGTGRERELPGETSVADLAGTPLYMAPELFRSERASIQSDVYSVAVLLYRLATGSFPVAARSLDEVREAHAQGRARRLRDERSDLPGAFIQIVERALSPGPSSRYESAGALEMALTGLLASTTVDIPVQVSAPRRSTLKLGLVAAAALAAGLAGGWFVASRDGAARPDGARPVRFLVNPPPGTEFESFSLAPSGRHVAFTAAGQLWVKSLDSLEATRIGDTQGAHDPFWAPDSQSIAYFKQNSLWVVGIAGGESRVVCPAWNAMGGTWSSAGMILFAADLGQAIYRVAPGGGDRTPIRAQGKHGFDLRWPSFVPGTDAFIYSARPGESAARTLFVGRLSGGTDNVLVETEANAQVSSGRLLFLRQGQLFAQPFDNRSLTLHGAAVAVAERLPSNLYRRIDQANFSAAAPGAPILAFLGTRQVDRELHLVGRDGSNRLLLGPGEYRDLAVSPDGARLAFEQLDEVTGTRDIWIMDLERRQPLRVTIDPHDDLAPVWSADGQSLFYASNRRGGAGIYRRPADGTGEEERLLLDLVPAVPYDVSRDGARLVFTRLHQRRDLDLWLLRLAPPFAEAAYRTSPWRESEPRFSPDGRWLVYSTTDTGDRHVYIERVDRPGPRWQVSVKNGREPYWRGDGREIFYHGPDRTLMAVAVDLTRDTPVIGTPAAVAPLRFRGWDVRYHYAALPDGKGFVMNVPTDGSVSSPMTFVLNW
jgi:Tol biopolymer transport system component